MPGPQITAELFLKLHREKTAKEIEDALLTGTKRAERQVQRTVTDAFRTSVIDALSSGKTGDAIKKLHKTGIIGAQQEYLSLLRKAEAAKDKADKARFQRQAADTKRLLDERMRAMKREQDLIMSAAKEQRAASKNMAEQFQNGAENFRGAVSGGWGGLARGAQGAGNRMHRFGEGKIEKAKQLEAAGADPKMVGQMAKMGSSLAKVGAALATVAAVVGAVVVLVKLFADLESKIKDMNKELIAGAGAADFGLGAMEIRGGGVRKTLEKMREDTTALNDNFMKFRVVAKEQQQILSGLNQAGYTFARMNEEIGKGADHMKSYSDATALAITYSRNLGVSTGEISQQMGAFTLETGMGLKDVAEQFSVITREAMVAGFATKRFYATVVEVTSGMGFYSVRIDETARLLKTFDSLLGETVGAESFKKLVGQYKDKGAQDRIKEIILKDQNFAQEQFGKAFERQISRLARDFEMKPEDVRKLLSMDELGLSQELRSRGMRPEQMDQFMNARLVGQAAQGGMGAMTRAMPFAGAGFDVAMASQATQVFSGKRIDEVLRDLSVGDRGAAELAGLEQVTGKSLDELEKLGRLFTRAEADLQEMRDLSERMQRGDYVPNDEDMRKQKEIGDRLGLFVDDSGNIMRGVHDANGRLVKENAIAINDALDVVSSQPTEGEEQLEAALTKDQEIATEISRNITGLNEIMEQSVLSVLNDIYNVLAGFFEAWSDKAGVEAQRLAAVESARATRLGLEGDLESLESQMADLDGQIAKASEAQNASLVRELTAKKNDLEVQKDMTGKQIVTMAKLETELQTADDASRTLGDQLGELEKQGAVTLSEGAWAKGLDQAVVNIMGEQDDPLAGMRGVAMFGMEQGRRVGSAFGEGEASTAAIASYMRENFDEMADDERKAFLQTVGGMEAFNRAMVEAERAMNGVEQEWNELDNTFYLRRKRMGKQAFEAQIVRETMATSRGDARASTVEGFTRSDIEKAMEWMPMASTYGKAMLDKLDAIETASEGTAQATKDGVIIDATRAQDLIIPAGGGQPVITDPADTVMAFKPGGPISRGMGGGGSVQVNVYGGDQKKVYDTVMRVLKATGNA
jgi:hypothetical protein